MLFMIGAYLIAGMIDYPFILGVFNKFIQTLVGLLPILIFVFGIIFVVDLFLSPEKIKKHLGHDSGWKGWLYAVLGSVFIVSPPYVIFPLLGEFKDRGMKYSLMAVFLGNRNVQPAFLPVMVYYFGLTFTVVISIYILAFSILTGVIMGKVMKEGDLIQL